MRNFGVNAAGLFWLGFYLGNWDYTVHFFVKYKYWRFGKVSYWYNGPMEDYGLGPFVLICRMMRA